MNRSTIAFDGIRGSKPVDFLPSAACITSTDGQMPHEFHDGIFANDTHINHRVTPRLHNWSRPWRFMQSPRARKLLVSWQQSPQAVYRGFEVNNRSKYSMVAVKPSFSSTLGSHCSFLRA